MEIHSHHDPAAGDGVQSALMYEFKSNSKSKRYELKDIYEHIAEFSGDQHGSRFIQTKLETANSDEKERVFREIEPNAIPLMTDVFGNYVIQKFFEHGDQTHKKILANKMRGQVLTLSLQMYGCRVVQKALDHVLVDQQAMLVGELKEHVIKCVKDQNGNHVIQKAIERCPPQTIEFITAAFRGQVQQLSIHPYGCRVVQRCLERCDTPSKTAIMGELMDGIPHMIPDQYGNYVVQHVVSKDEGPGKARVLQTVLGSLENFSKHKFASNVVEKCIEQADDYWRRQVVYILADGNSRRLDSEAVLVSMIKDNFGNYVIQKLLDTLCAEDFTTFMDQLQPAVNQAKRTGCGKQMLSIEKKMHSRMSPGRWTNGSGSIYGQSHGGYGLQMPTPPFASHYGSAATTPPPLTSDTQSLQSSNISSVNGDTVEGADRSRKGSEVINDESRYVGR
ncbi:ARM repeat-containing protein [Teratosphaeria nubilosa]|uniref:Pumilio homology domain family member 3 n=1 Tax=Teratosphaeria nubilosa TaxID=161662 RepID=A0A6G1L490_9PEZI|nr:ARM repeat-containing protein [Teratosphaeria nubilosa]